MVCIAENAAAKVFCLFPGKAAFIQKNAHKFGNGKGRVRVVDMNCRLFRQIFKGAVFCKVAAYNIGDGGAAKEILLLKAQKLSFRVAVVGIEN